MPDEAREIHPFQLVGPRRQSPGDFSAYPVPADAEVEPREAPKASPVQESAASSNLTHNTPTASLVPGPAARATSHQLQGAKAHRSAPPIPSKPNAPALDDLL